MKEWLNNPQPTIVAIVFVMSTLGSLALLSRFWPSRDLQGRYRALKHCLRATAIGVLAICLLALVIQVKILFVVTLGYLSAGWIVICNIGIRIIGSILYRPESHFNEQIREGGQETLSNSDARDEHK